MSTKIWTNEGERIVVLKDVDNLTSEEVWEKVSASLTEEEKFVVGDCVDEGAVLDKGEEAEFSHLPVEEMNFNMYVAELKAFAKSCLE